MCCEVWQHLKKTGKTILFRICFVCDENIVNSHVNPGQCIILIIRIVCDLPDHFEAFRDLYLRLGIVQFDL